MRLSVHDKYFLPALCQSVSYSSVVCGSRGHFAIPAHLFPPLMLGVKRMDLPSGAFASQILVLTVVWFPGDGAGVLWFPGDGPGMGTGL